MTIIRTEKIGDATLYLGDCLEILPTLGVADVLMTDPPYGIGFDAKRGLVKFGWKHFEETRWDGVRPDKCAFEKMLAASKEQLIWGGNYFADLLPPTMRWLIWDKGQRHFTLSDFEMAWCSQQKAARIFDYPRSKALADGKQHPTQKPIAVMRWCLNFFPDAKIVLDPYMGSGTTGVACASMSKTFIGIEINEGYFEIACKRIDDAYKQGDLFVAPPEKPEQYKINL